MAGPGAAAWNTPPPPPGTEIERIRSSVEKYFPVYETRVTPNSLVLLVHADPATLEPKFDGLRRQLWDQFYVPQIRRERGEFVIEVVRRPNRLGWGWVVNLTLLALTVVTTVTAGAFLWLAYIGGSVLSPVDFVDGGLSFALPLLLILGLHELAHYVVARRHHVDASLPFFIPVPPPFILFGTFGAFISLREPIPDKKALLDIGAAGPLAGFAVAIPVSILGLFFSVHSPDLSVANCGPTVFGVPYGNFAIGPSLIWAVLSQFVPMNLVNLHPVALAGWVGILVTAINLLPAGQLDGGHVFRALLGDRAKYVSYAAVVGLFALGIFRYEGWVIFAVLILFLGMRHPPPLNDITPLDRKRVGLGVLTAAILVTGFVIQPIASPTGAFTIAAPSVSLAPLPTGAHMADNISVTVTDQDFAPHGYLVSGTIVGVIATVGNQSKPLNGSELAAFEANSTWTLYLPNGNVTTYAGTGSFTVSAAEYFAVQADRSATFNVTFTNARQAAVVVQITVSELCSPSGSTTQSQKVTLS